MEELNKAQINELDKTLENSIHKAEELIKDREKTEEKIDEAIEKVIKVEEEKGIFEKIWEDLPVMFGMAKDWITGTYKDVSLTAMLTILGGIIYFLSPIDLIPDFLPVIGYLDDLYILSTVIDQVRKEIDKYKVWKKANEKSK